MQLDIETKSHLILDAWSVRKLFRMANFQLTPKTSFRYEERLDDGYQYYYREDTRSPLLPFGFGFSYTTFKFSEAKVSVAQMLAVDGTINVCCMADNNGHRCGRLIVQLHIALLVHQLFHLAFLRRCQISFDSIYPYS
jgi:hypothetical protein